MTTSPIPATWLYQNSGMPEAYPLVAGTAGKRIHILFLVVRALDTDLSKFFLIRGSGGQTLGRTICYFGLGEQVIIPGPEASVLLGDGESLEAYFNPGLGEWLCGNGIYQIEDMG